MNKNGFTLVELLGAIVIITIIALMGSVGIGAAKKGINEYLWKNNVELIESAAESFGNDKKSYIKNLDTNINYCTIDNKKIAPCLKVSVQTLINRNYLNTKETIDEYNGKTNFKVIINKTKDKKNNESDNFTSGYYVNNAYAYIYIDKDIVYAKYGGL